MTNNITYLKKKDAFYPHLRLKFLIHILVSASILNDSTIFCNDLLYVKLSR